MRSFATGVVLAFKGHDFAVGVTTCTMLKLCVVQRHVRVQRCLPLLRGILLTYPAIRPAPSPPSPSLTANIDFSSIDITGGSAALPNVASTVDIPMSTPLESSPRASDLRSDDQMSIVDVLALLEEPSLGQVAAVLRHLRVFGVSARRQAKVIGPTWDEHTGTGDDSAGTDCSDAESGVKPSRSEDSADTALLGSSDPAAILEMMAMIDDMEVYIKASDAESIPPDAVVGAPLHQTIMSRGSSGVAQGLQPFRPAAGRLNSVGNEQPARWISADAAILGARAVCALGLVSVPVASPASSRSLSTGSSEPAVDAGDPVSFADGISALLDHLAFVLLRGERCLSLAEASVLWREVVSAVLTPSERTRGFAWFTQASTAVSGGGVWFLVLLFYLSCSICVFLVPSPFPTPLQALLVLAAFEGPTDKQTPPPVSLLPLAPAGVGLIFSSDVATTLFADRLTVPAQVASLCSDAAGFSCWRAYFLYANGKMRTMSHSGSHLAALGAASVGAANGDAAADAAAIAKEVAASFASSMAPPSAGANTADFRVLQVCGAITNALFLFRLCPSALLTCCDMQLDLQGLDVLWYLTLHTSDPTVAAAAVAFLTLLQQRLSDELAPRIFEFRKRYLERCMAYIASAASRNGIGSSAPISNFRRAWPWALDEGIPGAPEATAGSAAATGSPRTASIAGLRISSSTDRGILAPPLLLGGTGSASRPGGLIRSRSSDSKTGDALGTMADTMRLIERCVGTQRPSVFLLFDHQVPLSLCSCVALLDKLLDEADDEADAIRVGMHDAVARVAAVRAVFDSAARNGNAVAKAAYAAVEEVFRPLILASHAAVRATSHASSVDADIAFAVDGEEAAPEHSQAVHEGGVMMLRLNCVFKVPVPELPVSDAPAGRVVATVADDGAAASASSSKLATEDDVLYGPGPALPASTSAAVLPPPLPLTTSVPVSGYKGEVRMRFGAAERAGDLREAVTAALAMPMKLMVPALSYTSTGAMGASVAMLAAAAASSGTDPLRANALKEIKGWMLGRSLADLGILDKACFTVMKTVAAGSAAAAIPAWQLNLSTETLAQVEFGAARWEQRIPGLSSLTAKSLATLEAGLIDMIARFRGLPAQMLSSSSRHLDTLLSVVDTFATRAASDGVKEPTVDGDESVAGTVASKAWRLLCRIPTGVALAEAASVATTLAAARSDRASSTKMSDDGLGASPKVDWSALFPEESPARLLYALLAVLPRLPSMVADAAAFPFPTLAHFELPPALSAAARSVGGKEQASFVMVAKAAHSCWRHQALSSAGLLDFDDLSRTTTPQYDHLVAAASASAAEDAKTHERGLVACGGVAHLVALLRSLVMGSGALSATVQSPLRVAAAALTLKFLQVCMRLAHIIISTLRFSITECFILCSPRFKSLAAASVQRIPRCLPCFRRESASRTSIFVGLFSASCCLP
jgi:hypothetical protein